MKTLIIKCEDPELLGHYAYKIARLYKKACWLLSDANNPGDCDFLFDGVIKEEAQTISEIKQIEKVVEEKTTPIDPCSEIKLPDIIITTRTINLDVLPSRYDVVEIEKEYPIPPAFPANTETRFQDG